jgi:AcrR family transcriptional regulator
MTGHRKPLQERSRKTYDTLLEAAGALLEEVGIERISTNLICQRAQVTAPAFYRYFDDKYAVIGALAERLLKRHNIALEEWVVRYRDAGYDVIVGRVLELLREIDMITASQPGAVWIMRALRAVPKLTHIRLASHNYVTDLLTDIYMPYLPGVPRETIRRRTRLSVEIAYSIGEMLKEEAADRDLIFQDADDLFRSMYYHPDYLAALAAGQRQGGDLVDPGLR